MTTQTTYQAQVSNEVRSSSEAFTRTLHSFWGNLHRGQEYQTEYGKKALDVLIPLVEDELIKLVDKKNQHNNKFWWNVARPAIKGDKKVAKKLADSISLILVAQLSKTPLLTNTIRRIADAAFNVLCIEYTEREQYDDQAVKFFMGIVQMIEKEADIILISRSGLHEPYTIQPTAQWNALMDDSLSSLNAFASMYEPMVCEPIDHSDLLSSNGGYYITPSPLMKKHIKVSGKIHPAIATFNSTNNPEFFEEVNNIQRTPYCVNTKLYEVIKEYYSKGYCFIDFPDDLRKVEELINEEKSKAVLAQNNLNKYYAEKDGIEFKEVGPKGIKKLGAEVSSKWNEAQRKTIDILRLAEFYAGYDKFWFPVYFDGRGRRYTYVPTSSLTYMGTKLSKGLVSFANKQALTKQGVRQLFYTLANAMDLDKQSLRMKGIKAVKWWQENEEAFMNGDYSTIFNNQSSFDDPINALAIILELVAFKKDSSYLSGYIAHRDARCSGASIIGTLLNDEKAMTLTSVLDVAKDASMKLPDAYMAASDSGYELNTDAYFAENSDVLFKRGVWKTPTMCMTAYGATRSTVHSGNEGNGGNKKVFEDAGLDMGKLNDFTELMMEALDHTLPSCFQYQKSLKLIGREFLKNNGHIFYSNPLTGFPVIRRKNKVVKDTLESPSSFSHQRIRLVINKHTNELNLRKTTTSLIPDAIHSVDGAILMKVGQSLRSKGIDTSTIHDSIGTHPNDVSEVVKAYANTMYEIATGNVLESIFEQLGGVAPTKYELSQEQLESIKTSKHILV